MLAFGPGSFLGHFAIGMGRVSGQCGAWGPYGVRLGPVCGEYGARLGAHLGLVWSSSGGLRYETMLVFEEGGVFFVRLVNTISNGSPGAERKKPEHAPDSFWGPLGPSGRQMEASESQHDNKHTFPMVEHVFLPLRLQRRLGAPICVSLLRGHMEAPESRIWWFV